MKKLSIAVLSCFILTSCGGGSSSNNVIIDDTPKYSVLWEQTSNSITVEMEEIGIHRTRSGFGAFDLYGLPYKSFFFPSGGEFLNTVRSNTDKDAVVFSFNGNQIYIDKPPISPKYIAGFVTNILEGNFGYGPKSLVMIDQGRESTTKPPETWEGSYLWRMDYNNGAWSVTEFAKELGRQFWHSGSNPTDINGDGKLDFVVSNLDLFNSQNKLTVFLSTNVSHQPKDLSKLLCGTKGFSSGTSSIVKLANNSTAVVSFPYSAKPEFFSSDQASILYLNAQGDVTNKQCFQVRNTMLTKDLTDNEGFVSIKVLDLNGDGLDDFIAVAEDRSGGNNKLKRLLYFIQKADSTFELSNNNLDLAFTYTLPNTNSENYSDWVNNEFIVVNADENTKDKEIFFNTSLVSHNDILKYGIRGGINVTVNKGENLNINPKQIVWNNLPKPEKYQYIFPTEINNDNIVDFLLVEMFFDPKYITSTNVYGGYFKISALLSKKQ